MLRARYVGQVPALQGKTALIRPDPVTEEHGRSFPLWLAQFDDPVTYHRGQWLGFGWHVFEREEFEVMEDSDGDY